MSDYDFQDLPKFQSSISLHLQEGRYTLQDEEEGRFTTLRELFEVSQNNFISIDMKDKDDELCHKVD